MLLYRNATEVRCNFDSEKEYFEEQKSLISFFLKEEMVMIEVFLYNEAKQLSITSNVSALELFGKDPTEIDFCERVKHLENMVDKLFILQEDNKYHMKVEANAEPMSVVLERRKNRRDESSADWFDEKTMTR